MTRGGKTMEHEGVFNKDGFYRFVVKSNAIMHNEAIDQGKKILMAWIQKHPKKSPIRVLDLACGGMPITIAAMMEHCKEAEFTFCGVDINKDQIEYITKEFVFPHNVVHRELIHGDAWSLHELPIAMQYEIVFTGLNFHHGTPKELFCMGKQIYDRLVAGGLLINHDLYRPTTTQYIRRPDYDPEGSAESFVLLPTEKMSYFEIDRFQWLHQDAQLHSCDWRENFISGLHNYLISAGGADRDVSDNMKHIRRRDYPVSTDEIRDILSQVPLQVTIQDYNTTSHPLKQYFAMVTAVKENEL